MRPLLRRNVSRKNLLEIDGNTISIAASTAGQNALEGGRADDRHTLFGEFLISRIGRLCRRRL